MEDKGIQTDPVDDDDPIEDYFETPSPRRLMGSPSRYNSTQPDAVEAAFGSGPSRASGSRGPEEAQGRGGHCPPALPPLTPNRAGSTHARAHGGNGGGGMGGMLLTPPGTSHTGKGSGAAGQHGRHTPPLLPLEVLEPTTPSAQKDKGREMSRSTAGPSQWQMIQDDPVRAQLPLSNTFIVLTVSPLCFFSFQS